MAEQIRPQLLTVQRSWWRRAMEPTVCTGCSYDDGTALLECRYRRWHPVAWWRIARAAVGLGPRYVLAVAEEPQGEA